MSTQNIGRILPINQGEYSATTTYFPLDIVTSNGSAYTPVVQNTGQSLTDANYWRLLVAKGDQGAPGNVGPQGVTTYQAWANSSDGVTGFTTYGPIQPWNLTNTLGTPNNGMPKGFTSTIPVTYSNGDLSYTNSTSVATASINTNSFSNIGVNDNVSVSFMIQGSGTLTSVLPSSGTVQGFSPLTLSNNYTAVKVVMTASNSNPYLTFNFSNVSSFSISALSVVKGTVAYPKTPAQGEDPTFNPNMKYTGIYLGTGSQPTDPSKYTWVPAQQLPYALNLDLSNLQTGRYVSSGSQMPVNGNPYVISCAQGTSGAFGLTAMDLITGRLYVSVAQNNGGCTWTPIATQTEATGVFRQQGISFNNPASMSLSWYSSATASNPSITLTPDATNGILNVSTGNFQVGGHNLIADGGKYALTNYIKAPAGYNNISVSASTDCNTLTGDYVWVLSGNQMLVNGPANVILVSGDYSVIYTTSPNWAAPGQAPLIQNFVEAINGQHWQRTYLVGGTWSPWVMVETSDDFGSGIGSPSFTTLDNTWTIHQCTASYVRIKGTAVLNALLTVSCSNNQASGQSWDKVITMSYGSVFPELRTFSVSAGMLTAGSGFPELTDMSTPFLMYGASDSGAGTLSLGRRAIGAQIIGGDWCNVSLVVPLHD